jgi:hypothetical protein
MNTGGPSAFPDGLRVYASDMLIRGARLFGGHGPELGANWKGNAWTHSVPTHLRC